MKTAWCCILALCLVGAPGAAGFQSASAQGSWGALDHLVGTWVADSGSGGQPGQTVKAGESWQRDLDNHVLIRRDFSEYPAAPDRPATRHEGLTVVTRNSDGTFNAHVVDNEDHVIDYDVTTTGDDIVFTSRPAASAPQFRLTYKRTASGYAVVFEIAPPGSPGRFSVYVAGGIHPA